MPVSLNSQLGSKEQADAHLAQAIMSAMRVSIPGIIQSFDPEAVTAVIQPAIKGVEHDASGAEVSVNLPLLVDVPVIFPRGGGCTLTFPLKKATNARLSLRTAALISGGRAGHTGTGRRAYARSLGCVLYRRPAVAGKENRRYQHYSRAVAYR